ncbi:islet amyloid polypeptide [Crotalus tigris]|uniref:islet amyloid polypeptide n=1 Tax=Crotalus tigris TaxID=88082 RepID=UPI00192FAD77|nr:islet amyloid polypeptide [Crotalus tigris]
MCSLKGPFIFIILSLTLNSLEATTPVKSHHLEKRKCNTATCVTQRLADFLVRSSNTIGTIYSPTNVGANTYGKRGREVPNYLQL